MTKANWEQPHALSDLLASADRLPWDRTVYVRPDPAGRLSLGSQCRVLDQNEPEDPNDLPSLAKANGLEELLPVAVFQDVVTNAHAQKPNVTLAQLVQAVEFYRNRDAFIEF